MFAEILGTNNMEEGLTHKRAKSQWKEQEQEQEEEELGIQL